jgi:hypothetical protein
VLSRRVGLRAAALAGVTVAAAAAVSGCGTGQVNQTAYMSTAIAGVNQSFAVTAPDPENPDGGSISVRDMLVSYPGAEGYKKGGDAPLQVGVFNDTPGTLKVTITAPGTAESVTFKAGAATQASSPEAKPSPSEPAASASASASAKPRTSASAKPGASASASASTSPSAEPKPPSGPATFTIPSGEFVMLAPAYGKFLLLQGLSKDIKPGDTIGGVTFQFQLDGGLQLVPQPASPAPGASPVAESCVFSNGMAVCRAPMGTPASPQPRSVPTNAEHE